MSETDQMVIERVSRWAEEIVIGWNLCPFAKREFVNDRVRFQVSQAETEEQLLVDLVDEFGRLDKDADVETTVLIHPKVLSDFHDYNDFLGLADDLLVELGREGIYQIASFHPQYQFAGTKPQDPENYTNKSPYPLLHLLREQSMAEAVESYPDVSRIPRDNIDLMNKHGREKLEQIFGDL
jgi:hypothetical protein